MAVKRDYGSFAKATQRLLPALVSAHGYEHVGNGFFARKRPGWLEGFWLQQSQWGSGDFCITMGVHVPSLYLRWQSPNPGGFGLCISFRLSERGADQGDRWLPAANKQELADSLAKLASWLPLVDRWFEQFQSMSDVARAYRERTNLVEAGKNKWGAALMAANYGFLLTEAGEVAQARIWLQEAERLMSLPVYWAPNEEMVHEQVKGARLQKPSREYVRQLEAVRRSLHEIAP